MKTRYQIDITLDKIVEALKAAEKLQKKNWINIRAFFISLWRRLFARKGNDWKRRKGSGWGWSIYDQRWRR